ncbi:rhomboid family intramembrane serine protease [Nocardiopsis potens]|uniref:rhomboid family intramembrane serine protease n=1 Tax=Nocardiopsis potens TaxID=1246458 RepID=UPI00034B4889|nr:rhomboid family intramembrane serine protease [Nocardiopsis potens]
MSAEDSGTEGAGAAPAVPTCYRHPDRETYVSCTRCERNICPDCMREAAVGHQCPDCVAEGNRGLRAPRTVLGGKAVSAPYATWTFLALMVLGYVAQLVDEAVSGGMLTGALAMNPWRVIVQGDWYLLITAAFLHGGVLHLAFNGFALYVVGRQLEDWLGHLRFTVLWLLSAVGGSVLSMAVAVAGAVAAPTPADIPVQLSVGASGAIFGLFGAVLLVGRRLRLDTRFILGLLAVNLLITFLVPGISWTAHIGGLATGLVLGAGFAYLPRREGASRTAAHIAVAVAWAVVLAAVAVASAVIGTDALMQQMTAA